MVVPFRFVFEPRARSERERQREGGGEKGRDTDKEHGRGALSRTKGRYEKSRRNVINRVIN